ncbi:MAG: HesA/MoeB/ThiF family protein [Nitrososphaeria archaeon]|nr:HesA/MoeB/ThiF family protein [Nitrososphaeria archaeon]
MLTMELSEEEFERYSRQIILKYIGYEGQLKLKNSRVCVAGLGGLGSIIAYQLTAMGFGHVRLVDRDVVERSNLHRQYLYDVKSIGLPKVEVAYEKLKKLNPNVKLEPYPISVNEFSAEEVLKDVDLVIDGFDRISPRYAVNRACIRLGIPYIFGAALETYGNVSTIIPGKTPCLECIFPSLDDRRLPTCSTVGVHPSLLSIIASIEVSEAVNLVLGSPKLAGKLLYFDLADYTIVDVSVSRVSNCPVCSGRTGKIVSNKKDVIVEEVCGRMGLPTYIISPTTIKNLDILHARVNLENSGAKIVANGKFGLTFTVNDFYVSVLKSGVMVIVGAKSVIEAEELYVKFSKVF